MRLTDGNIDRVSLIGAALLFGTSLAAQEIEALPEVRRYTVEVIIFEYTENVSAGTEVFAPDEPPEPAETNSEFVFEDVPTEPAVEEVTDEEQPPGPEFILHLEDEFTLANVASRLEQLDVYEPIMHFAWTQVTLPEEETQAIELPSLAETPERLSGSFMLYLSRYLHLVVDLTLDDLSANGEPVAIDESTFAYADKPYGEFPAQPIRFRINENRIFKNGDLRYFDHPKFGVLAKIIRVEEEEDETDTVEPEMLGDDLVGGLGQ